MKKSILEEIIVCAMAMANIASATVVRGINIDFVTIGNPGNPGDTRTEANPNSCGSVGYKYQIGKYEVTNKQWDAFVSVAGAPAGNPYWAYDASARWTAENIPTNKVSWCEAAQFCNYLTSGDKSQGAYLFSGNDANAGDFLDVDRDSAMSAFGVIYVLPTEDEWYKAAYYTGSGYSTYANGTDIEPIKGVDSNYIGAMGGNGRPWDVGTGTIEQNGTFDMMGNQWEYNETPIDSSRGRRGGSYFLYDEASSLTSYFREGCNPYSESEGYYGFRIVQVPEPLTLLLLGLGALMLRRKR